MTQSFSTKLLAATVREIRGKCKDAPNGTLARAIDATGREFHSRINQHGDRPEVFIGVPTGMHQPLIELGMVLHETQIENRWNVSANGREILRKLGYGKLAQAVPANQRTIQASASTH